TCAARSAGGMSFSVPPNRPTAVRSGLTIATSRIGTPSRGRAALLIAVNHAHGTRSVEDWHAARLDAERRMHATTFMMGTGVLRRLLRRSLPLEVRLRIALLRRGLRDRVRRERFATHRGAIDAYPHVL